MIPELVQIISILLVAVVFHEYAHGWVANKCGDPTAKLLGRLTLNPIRHIDPVGTIAVPFACYFLLGFPFGWAKPVPVDFRNLRDPKRDMIWVALAGPAINFVIAFILSLFLLFDFGPLYVSVLSFAIIINLVLAVFNLVPVPPLDGSRVVMGLLPDQLARPYSYIEPFGIIVVVLLVKFKILDFVWKFVQYLASALGVPAYF